MQIDPRYYRPTEVELLIGDPTKSKTKLGWKPKYTLDMLIEEMALSDLRLFQKDQLLKKEGFNVLNYFE
jgi:GDPmannose 4,6-dehydratase